MQTNLLQCHKMPQLFYLLSKLKVALIGSNEKGFKFVWPHETSGLKTPSFYSNFWLGSGKVDNEKVKYWNLPK